MLQIHEAGGPDTVATIDIGTNTALLLISTWKEGKLVVLHDETRFVRLGEGVDAAGIVNKAALKRLSNTLLAYKKIAESWEVSDIIIGATSASRDAANQKELISYVRTTTGLTYGIISGLEEAKWSFQGVCAGLEETLHSILAIDIGGGSTELTEGRSEDETYVISQATSLDVGSVRLTEKFFSSQPPSMSMIDRATGWLMSLLQALPAEYLTSNSHLIGASGTTTVLAILSRQLSETYVHQHSALGSITLDEVDRWCSRLLKMSREEVLALNAEVMKGREDVFPAGILILRTLMTFLQKDKIQVNSWGLRHGLALRFWQRQ